MTKENRHKIKISTDSSNTNFGESPFSGIELSGLPDLPKKSDTSNIVIKKSDLKLGNGERLEIRREKTGRGGKTVTTINGFPTNLSNSNREKILKILKNSLGTGGTWRDSIMELQGDRRSAVLEWLKGEGYRPVLAGG